MAESKEELKIHLMRLKEESERAGSRLNIKKSKIMASGSITAWQIKGENKVVTDFLCLVPKSVQMVTAAMKSEDDCFLARKV